MRSAARRSFEFYLLHFLSIKINAKVDKTRVAVKLIFRTYFHQKQNDHTNKSKNEIPNSADTKNENT